MFYKEGFGKPESADTTYTTVKEVSLSLVPDRTEVIQFNYVLDSPVFASRNPRNLTLRVDSEGAVSVPVFLVLPFLF